MTPIKSISHCQEDIINNILSLHVPQGCVDVDITYSKGVFYKNGKVQQPRLKFDKFPQTEDTTEAYSYNLPLNNNSINCVMYDPPFVISGKTYLDNKEGSSKIAKRFSAYENWTSLKEDYYNTLKECHRILDEKGILIMKLQNTVSGGKQHFTHHFIIKSAIELGYYPKDEFVLLSKSKMTSFGGRWKTQQHAMKHHSYFLVLQKTKNKTNYELS